jgi:hypothetical protein
MIVLPSTLSGPALLEHRNGCIFYTDNPRRLVQALEWRGWYAGRPRGGRGLARLYRNDDVIDIGLQGTVVAVGETALAVLHELTGGAQ